VLAEVALVLKVALREGDLLSRLAGDEFAIVLPDCDLAPARRLAERLRHAVEEHRFARVGRLSCSAGIASGPRDGLDATELLAAAEQALGLAKKAGRRRTVQSGPGYAH
jgi:diguanylate cyclase (GGDEF)-like protein